MDAGRSTADWRTPADYAFLARCGRHAFAWEWLRRSVRYRDAVGDSTHAEADASRFGLHRFEPAGSASDVARPIWQGDADPHVLAAVAAPSRCGDDAFDFAGLAPLATCVDGDDGSEHWLWSDGTRHIRLDVAGHSLRSGPVALDFRIAGFARALVQADTLGRLVRLARTGHLIPRLFAPEARAARWVLVLRTHDALMAGASQREIAEHLFDIGDVARWRVVASSDRERVRRLVTAARAAARVDPRCWLDGSYP